MRKLRQKKGTVLIFAYSILAALLVLSGTTVMRAVNDLNQSVRNALLTQALYLAEGAVDEGARELAIRVANFQNVPASFSNNLAINPDFTVTYAWDELAATDTSTSTPLGITTFSRIYKITGTAFLNKTPEIKVNVRQIISRNKTFTFQHAVFYADTLEMLPGPNMTLSGRVHSNSDIYLDANNTLTINSNYLYSAGNIYNRRFESGGIPLTGTVRIQVDGAAPGTYQDMKTPPAGNSLRLDSANPLWMDPTVGATSRWGGSVRSTTHGVTSLAIPAVGNIAPGGYYDQQASTSANTNIKIENNTITRGGITLVDGTDMPPGTITSSATMYNNREGRWVRMTEIDMKKLAGYNTGDTEGSPSFPNNLPGSGLNDGLIYATRDDASSGEQNGIRLKNGDQVRRAKGVTVVSNLPVYIQGNYNSTDKKPTSVISDSVNILSTGWNDSNSTKSLGSRPAANTTVNTAFIAGVKPTPSSSGDYSGGLENYPRLHEQWSGKTLTIRGSFVELWPSSIAQGSWVYGNPQYEAPNRNWDYDADFNNADNLPPFTPFAVETKRLVWW